MHPRKHYLGVDPYSSIFSYFHLPMTSVTPSASSLKCSFLRQQKREGQERKRDKNTQQRTITFQLHTTKDNSQHLNIFLLLSLILLSEKTAITTKSPLLYCRKYCFIYYFSKFHLETGQTAHEKNLVHFATLPLLCRSTRKLYFPRNNVRIEDYKKNY